MAQLDFFCVKVLFKPRQFRVSHGNIHLRRPLRYFFLGYFLTPPPPCLIYQTELISLFTSRDVVSIWLLYPSCNVNFRKNKDFLAWWPCYHHINLVVQWTKKFILDEIFPGEAHVRGVFRTHPASTMELFCKNS